MEPTLKVGQVAKLARVGIDTVRFYEREGLLPKVARSQSGYRLFPPATVQRVAFIKEAQGLGFSLIEVGKLLRAIDRGEGDRQGAQKELARSIARIDAKIDELRDVRRRLSAALASVDSGKCSIERIATRISFAPSRRN
jgi:DNA-binding transcriptional MerR regulator